MKIKHLSAFSMMIVIAFIASSCSVNHEIEKKLVGKWNPVNAENLTAASSVPEPTEVKVKVDTSTEEGVRKESEVTVAAQRSEKGQKLDRILANEMRSQLKVSIENDQRLVEKYYPGKTIKGTWKLKKQGKRIAVKIPDTGRKLTLDIVSITDSTFTVFEKMDLGQVKISYIKVR
jgi:hypothetical protein